MRNIYKLFNIVNKLTSIKLSNSAAQFYLILIIFYYNLIIEKDKNFNKNIKNTLLKICNYFKYKKVLFIYFSPNIPSTLVLLIFLIYLISILIFPSRFLILVKHKYYKSQKFLI